MLVWSEIVFQTGFIIYLTSEKRCLIQAQPWTSLRLKKRTSEVNFIFLSRTPQLVFANFPRTFVQNSCFWKLVNGFYFCAKRKFFFLCGLTNRSLRNNEWKKEAGQKQNREHNRKVTWTNFRKTVAYEQQNISSKSFGQRSQKGFFDSSSFWKITGNFFFHFSFSPILFSWEDCY